MKHVSTYILICLSIIANAQTIDRKDIQQADVQLRLRTAQIDSVSLHIPSASPNDRQLPTDKAVENHVRNAINARIPAGTVTGQTNRWNGSTWLANSTIFNNGTQVGINTANPSTNSVLTINGGISPYNNGSYSIIKIGDNAAANMTGANSVYLGRNAGNLTTISRASNTIIGDGAAGGTISGATTNPDFQLSVVIGAKAGEKVTGVGSGLTILGAQAAQNATGFGGGTAVGYFAAKDATTGGVYVGNSAGQSNTGTFGAFLGDFSGQNNTGSNCFFGGYGAGQNNKGGLTTSFGAYSAANANAASSLFAGYESGRYSGGNNQVALGANAGKNTTSTLNVSIGANAGSGQAHTGGSNTFIGFNTGSGNNFGSSVLIGTSTGASGEAYSATSYTFDAANVNPTTDEITGVGTAITGLGLTVDGARTVVDFQQGSGSTLPSGITNGANISIERKDANTIIILSGISTAGTGTTNFFRSITALTNVVAIGNTVNPTASNQIWLGNASATDFYVGGSDFRYDLTVNPVNGKIWQHNGTKFVLADPPVQNANALQTLSISGNNLSISSGNTVALPTAPTAVFEHFVNHTGTFITTSGTLPSNANKIKVYRSGVLMRNNATGDYTISGSTINFTNILDQELVTIEYYP